MSLRSSESQSTIRVLLALWELGANKTEVKRGDLTEKIKRKGEVASDYQNILDKLEQEGGISYGAGSSSAKSRNKAISLTETGLQMLGDSLSNPASEFEFDSQIGERTANAILRWMREMASYGKGAASKKEEEAIANYDEFKSVALEVYDKLNSDYNLNDLVPIYRMREEIGSRVTRSEFNEWLLEMQENDILQLTAGDVSNITSDKRENSISISGGGLRYYAKRLNP